MEASSRASFRKNVSEILQYLHSRTEKLVNESGDLFNCDNLSYEEKAIIILSRMTQVIIFQNEYDKANQNSINAKSNNEHYQNLVKNNNNNFENEKRNAKNKGNKAISINDLYNQISTIVNEKKKQNQTLKNITQIQIQRLYSLRFISNDSALTSEEKEALQYALSLQQKAKIILDQSTQAKAEISILEMENKNIEHKLKIFQRIINNRINNNNNDFSMTLRDQQARVNKARSSIEKLQRENQYLEMQIDSYEKRIKSMKISTDSHLSLAERALMNIPTKISAENNKSFDTSRNKNDYESINEFYHHKVKKIRRKKKNKNNNQSTSYEDETDNKNNGIEQNEVNEESFCHKNNTPRRKTHNKDEVDDQYFANEDQNKNINELNDLRKRKRKHKTHKTSNKNENDVNEIINNDDKNEVIDNCNQNSSSLELKKHTHKHKIHNNINENDAVENDQVKESQVSNTHKKRIRKRKTHNKEQNEQSYNDEENKEQNEQSYNDEENKEQNEENRLDDDHDRKQNDEVYNDEENEQKEEDDSSEEQNEENNHFDEQKSEDIENQQNESYDTSDDHMKMNQNFIIEEEEEERDEEEVIDNNNSIQKAQNSNHQINEQSSENFSQPSPINKKQSNNSIEQFSEDDKSKNKQNETADSSIENKNIESIQQNQQQQEDLNENKDQKQNENEEEEETAKQETLNDDSVDKKIESNENKENDDDKTASNDLQSERNSNMHSSSSTLGFSSSYSHGGFGTSQAKRPQPPRRIMMPGRCYQKPRQVCRLSLLNLNRAQVKPEASTIPRAESAAQQTKTAKEAAMEVVEIIHQFRAMLRGETENESDNENDNENNNENENNAESENEENEK